jgi:hypothetical protein
MLRFFSVGLNPSRRFNEILDLVNEKRLLQESFARAEALDLIHAYLGNHPQKKPPPFSEGGT